MEMDLQLGYVGGAVGVVMMVVQRVRTEAAQASFDLVFCTNG